MRLVTLIFCIFPFFSYCQKPLSKEEIFGRVFASQKIDQNEKSLLVDLIIDHTTKVELNALLNKKKLFVKREEIIQAIKEQIQDQYLQEVQNINDPLIDDLDNSWISIDTLKKVLDITYDSNHFILSLKTTAEKKRVQTHILSAKKQPPPFSREERFPEKISNYLNFYVTQDYIEKDGSSHFLSPHIYLENNLNIHNWVLEASAKTNSEPRRLTRGDIRLVHKNPRTSYNYSIGDIFFPTIGFQSALNIGGIAVSKDLSLNPFFHSEVISEHTIFLKTPARIDLFINNTKQKSFYLPSGTHNLRDLPLEAGHNDVKIVIKEEFSQERSLKMPLIFEPTLLKPGLKEKAIAFGFPVKEEGFHYQYATDKPILSLLWKEGIKDFYTFSSYMQTNPNQSIAGIQNFIATKRGLFGFDQAICYLYKDSLDFAFEANFTLYPKKKKNLSLGFEAEYRGKKFIDFTSDEKENDNRWTFSNFISKEISSKTHLNMTASLSNARSKDFNPYKLSFSLTKKLSRNIKTQINFSFEKADEKKHQEFLVFSINWTPSKGNQSISFTQQTNPEIFNLSFQHKPWKTTQINADLAKDETSEDYSVSIEHLGKRASYQLLQGYKKEEDQFSTSLTIGSAIAYCNGHIGLSRPIENSFALFSCDEKALKIGIQPSEDDINAMIDSMGPGIIGGLPSYERSMIYIEPYELQEGIDLKESVFKVKPGYKSGFHIPLKVEKTIIVSGTLKNLKGEALALKPGRVHFLDDPTAGDILFFSNKAGKFKIKTTKRGAVELHIGKRKKALKIEIPLKEIGKYEIGELFVP